MTWSLRRLVLLGAAFSFGVACGPTADFPSLTKGDRPPPPAELSGVVFEGYSAGSREVEVRAARAQVEPAERVVHLERVQIQFSDESRGQIEVKAEGAELRMDSDNFVLQGRVEGTTSEGEHFTTAEVRYVQAEQRLWTDQPVRLQRENFVLEGEGMEVDLAKRQTRVTGRVRATLEPK